MTHVVHKDHEWPQFTTTIKESSRAPLTLLHVFNAIPRRASVGGPHTIPYTFMRYGRVSSNSATIEATNTAGINRFP
jgi:acyl-[acyl carrier protein]--UDP-N-acetylglucosamine O-acyltransferase